MFFSSKKKKTARAIQLATIDVVTDSDLANSCGNLTNDEQTASWLCTEVMIQRIHALVFVLDRKFRQNYDWATWDFVTANINQGIQEGMGNNDFFSVVMNGLSRLMGIEGTGPERMNMVYDSSAQQVLEQDPTLNRDELIQFINGNVEKFMMGLGRYFD